MTALKTECRTPTKGRDGVIRIAQWKYDCVHAAILQAVSSAGSDGLACHHGEAEYGSRRLYYATSYIAAASCDDDVDAVIFLVKPFPPFSSMIGSHHYCQYDKQDELR